MLFQHMYTIQKTTHSMHMSTGVRCFNNGVFAVYVGVLCEISYQVRKASTIVKVKSLYSETSDSWPFKIGTQYNKPLYTGETFQSPK